MAESSGIIKFIGKGLGGSLGFFFRNFRFSFTALLIIILFASAIMEGAREGDVRPVLARLGTTVISYDQALKDNTKELITGNRAFLVWVSLVLNVWLYFMFGSVIFKIISKENTSEQFRHFITVIIIIAVLQLFINFILFPPQGPTFLDKVKDVKLPFEGVVYLFKNIDKVFGDLPAKILESEGISTSSQNLTGNLSEGGVRLYD